jgi:hypothetical protein
MVFVLICVGIYCILWNKICVVCTNHLSALILRSFRNSVTEKLLKLLSTVGTHPHKCKEKYACVCKFFQTVNTHLCKWGRFLYLAYMQALHNWVTGTYILEERGASLCTEYAANVFLWNDGSCLPNYTASHCCRSRITMWLPAWRLLAFRLLEELEGPQLS